MSAKVRKIIGILDRIRVKYLFSAAALLLFAQLVFGSSVPRGMLASAAEDSLRQRLSDSLRIHSEAAAEVPEAATQSRRDRREQARAAREQARRRAAFEALPQEQIDSLITQKGDSLEGRGADTIARDTVKEKKPQKPGAFLDDPISGKNKDSLVYDVRNKMVYIYNEGDITYQNSNLKADYMQINMDNKMVYAYGKPDSLEGKPIVTKPEFSEGDASYTMDTITYNLTSKKAKIKGVATQQGDGWLVGGSVKKMPDNTVNIQHGKYTTCDETDHPHFYLAMTKAKVIPGKKVVTGPAYLVMEDVPIYFLGIPEGFFPINMGPKSGLLMPTYGEEYTKGFFLRDMGYYFTLGDYADLAVRGGFYTLGSWEASAASRYIKRYKYSGSFNMQYSNIKTGEKGEPDYIKQSNFRIQWTHSQDPQGQPRVDLLGIGKLRDQRLQQIFGDQPQRHPLDADQLVDRLLEELGGHTLLALGEHVHLAELAEQEPLGDAADRGLQRLAFLPLQTQGTHGQGAVVRKDLDAVYGQDDQLGDHDRRQDLLEGDVRQHEERHRA